MKQLKISAMDLNDREVVSYSIVVQEDSEADRVLSDIIDCPKGVPPTDEVRKRIYFLLSLLGKDQELERGLMYANWEWIPLQND